jgi:beta-1,4-mannooligosaccharide/beta-1,4-mannosyl-N-acetylglucosamine phosphorylase
MISKLVTTLSGSNKSLYHELFRRPKGNPILSSHDWTYPVNTVFNPAAIHYKGNVLLLVRVEDRRGLSHLTKAVSADGMHDWQIDQEPTLEADAKNYPEEKWGIEDPRITWLDEIKKYAIVYTAYSVGGPLVSIALTENFCDFDRLGAVMLPDDKDAALFSRKIQGKWWLIHRPITPHYGQGAHIWVSQSDDLVFWGKHHILLSARDGAWWDANKIGLNTPPMETEEGWLLLYHGVKKTAAGSIYRLGLALLELENPLHVLRRSEEWILGPQEIYEKEGDVDDVVFPCGWIYDKSTDEIKVYYGAADTSIAVAVTTQRELLDYLRQCPKPDEADSKL